MHCESDYGLTVWSKLTVTVWSCKTFWCQNKLKNQVSYNIINKPEMLPSSFPETMWADIEVWRWTRWFVELHPAWTCHESGTILYFFPIQLLLDILKQININQNHITEINLLAYRNLKIYSWSLLPLTITFHLSYLDTCHDFIDAFRDMKFQARIRIDYTHMTNPVS